MKNLLILSLILTSIPAFAACPIDGDGSACIAQFSRQPLQQTYAPNSNVKEFSRTPEARLNPARVNAPTTELRNFRQVPNDYSYNSSCQFGVCNQTGTPQLFQQRVK